jgi:hypothetical protein
LDCKGVKGIWTTETDFIKALEESKGEERRRRRRRLQQDSRGEQGYGFLGKSVKNEDADDDDFAKTLGESKGTVSFENP